jgi:hypothetical protein
MIPTGVIGGFSSLNFGTDGGSETRGNTEKSTSTCHPSGINMNGL